MNTWQELLILCGATSGFIGVNALDLTKIGERHKILLVKAVTLSETKFSINNNVLMIESEPLPISQWLNIIEKTFSRVGDWYQALDETQLIDVDPFMIGLVSQLNRLGYITNYSCSGHGKRQPVLAFRDSRTSEIHDLFISIDAKFEIDERVKGMPQVNFPRKDESKLSQYALQLAKIDRNVSFCRVENLMQRDDSITILKELLEIPGKSGEENSVRCYLIKKLVNKVDTLEIDFLGNVTGTKRYGQHNQTVLLSAHMDIYDDFDAERKICINESIWSRPGEILGADDRAGVAMLLILLDDLERTEFKGVIKFAFTVQEECGRIGASAISSEFLSDVDYAVVLDRRGKGDIVTSCNGRRYCSFAFEKKINSLINKLKWNQIFKSVPGGISDITVWSNRGIESINVSIGFYNEHTSNEYLDIDVWNNSRKFVRDFVENVPKYV